MTRILFTTNKKIDAMIDRLKEEVGYISSGELTRAAIIDLYAKNFGIERIMIAETEKKIPLATKGQRNICELLGGTIKDRTCTFTKYEMVNPKLVEKFETSVPVSHLTLDLVDTQYSPSKAEVESVLAKSKK